ncbi:MAG: HupE/UreJ family protein [Amphritea sp.]|nr:HupE/UreJ family protein [Amphritea sp.]
MSLNIRILLWVAWLNGAELSLSANPLAYIAGFLMSTTVLLMAGARLGRLADHYRMGMLTRLAGVAMAAFGVLAVV